MKRVKIEIFSEGGISLPFRGLTERGIRNSLKRVCEVISLSNVIIALILTDDEFIRGINREYREKDSPTDIITFAYRENPFPSSDRETEHLGDIYLSLETAFENSREYSVEFLDEIKRLLVHGMLHLTGYDHELSEEDGKEMRDREEEILKML